MLVLYIVYIDHLYVPWCKAVKSIFNLHCHTILTVTFDNADATIDMQLQIRTVKFFLKRFQRVL